MKLLEVKTAKEFASTFFGDPILKWAVNKVLDNAPCFDVVQCKDCKHYRNHPNGLCYLHTEPYDNKQGYKGESVCVEPGDFCSYGEMKTNED